ncbi:MAG TPA: PqqD family protein [Vicinamibacterales bacterium]|nr:PqqD family protein [Vicinamibacterales bacterium]
MSDVYIARGERLAARKVDGEMVILRAEDSGLYVLNEIGTALWEAADGRTPLVAIVERVICPEYEIDGETALRDALEFVDALEAHGVLRRSSEPLAPETPWRPEGEA